MLVPTRRVPAPEKPVLGLTPTLVWPLAEMARSSGASSTYRQRLLDGLLDLHALPGDGLVQLPLKSQEIHVCLRLWDELPDLAKGQKLTGLLPPQLWRLPLAAHPPPPGLGQLFSPP